jgi:hypothetical protein
MEALKRKADLSVKNSMILEDGTSIELVGMSARKYAEITGNKKLSDFDRVVYATAFKIRVDGKEVCYDDLLDCFSDTELGKIIEFAYDLKDESPKTG